MQTNVTIEGKQISDYQFSRLSINLSSGEIDQDIVACDDIEDFLGSIRRSFKLLANFDVRNAFDSLQFH
jgi:hypothetical protein